MDIFEFIKTYKNFSRKDMTKYFNSFSVEDRLYILDNLDDKAKFVDKLGKQAVEDFWTHERELIRNGECTRNWTPEQIEAIMNISEKTGKAKVNGGVARTSTGEAYQGHHMLNQANNPQYAGDWQNIQALDFNEHRIGAHAGNTRNPTNGQYDFERVKLYF